MRGRKGERERERQGREVRGKEQFIYVLREGRGGKTEMEDRREVKRVRKREATVNR